MTIEVIDDFLPKFIFDRVSNMVQDTNFVWNCVPASYTTDKSSAFVHNVNNFPPGEVSELSVVVALYICEKYNMHIDQLRIIRYGLAHREQQYTIHTPHIDSLEPHMVALLYLNESDGDTILYKERYTNGLSPFRTVDELEVDKRVSPKPNRLVFFDGRIYHSSSTPTNNQLRYALNFNFGI